MKNRLLLLVLASAAALSGCVTTAGYRSHGGGYGSSSDYYRSGSSYPYGYYGGNGSYYGYDRYGYDSYGRSYGYPYGYAPSYNNRYYYYYPTPQRPPTTGTDQPPPQLDPNRPYRDNSQYRRPRVQTPIDDTRDSGLSRDLSRYRGVRQAAPAAPVYQDRTERLQPTMESPRRMRPTRQPMTSPRPSRAPASSSVQSAPAAGVSPSVLDGGR